MLSGRDEEILVSAAKKHSSSSIIQPQPPPFEYGELECENGGEYVPDPTPLGHDRCDCRPGWTAPDCSGKFFPQRLFCQEERREEAFLPLFLVSSSSFKQSDDLLSCFSKGCLFFFVCSFVFFSHQRTGASYFNETFSLPNTV